MPHLPPADVRLRQALLDALAGRAVGDALAALACTSAWAIHTLPLAQQEAARAALQRRTDTELLLRQKARAAIEARRAR